MATMKTVAGAHSDGWSYAAAGNGILNSAAFVTVAAAPAAGLRHYITSIQFMAEALGAATEFRALSSPTTLWRTKIGTGGQPQVSIEFDPPLKGDVAAAVQVQTVTASVTGAVYVNVQGFVAP